MARVRAAIVAAVREGRLDESRVAEAAARVASSHVPVAAARAADAPPFAELGLAAARRALLVQGTVTDGRPLLLVDLEGTTSVAAGLPSHDLASILGELGADVEAIHTTESRLDQALAAVHASPDRRPVVVSRDVDRHPWQQHAAAAILAAEPRGGVVVDVGYPAQSSAGAQRPHHDVRVRSRQPDGRRRAAARGTVTSELRATLRDDGPDRSLVDGVAAELIELGGEQLAPVEQLAR